MTRVFEGEISYFLPLNFLPEELIFVVSKKFIGFVGAGPSYGGKSHIVSVLNEKASGFSERYNLKSETGGLRCHAEKNSICIYGETHEILFLTYIDNRFDEIKIKTPCDKILCVYLTSSFNLVAIGMKGNHYLFLEHNSITEDQSIRDLSNDKEFTKFLFENTEHKISFHFDKTIIAKKEFPHDTVERPDYYYGGVFLRPRNLLIIAKITNKNTTLIEHHRCQIKLFCPFCINIIPNEPRFGYLGGTIVDFKTKRKYHVEKNRHLKQFKTNGRVIVTKHQKTLSITKLHLDPLKFKIIVAAGLFYSGKWHKFLVRGLYDPRLLMIIDSYV